MSSRRIKFTPEDDAILMALVKEAKENKVQLQAAFIKAAEQIGRDPDQVKGRYRRLTSPNLKSLANPKDMLRIKLKSLVHDRQRWEEKAKLYQEQRDEVKDQYTTLKKDYDKLSAEHADMRKLIQDVLGEE